MEIIGLERSEVTADIKRMKWVGGMLRRSPISNSTNRVWRILR